jgi:hypothetical protein
MLLKRLGPTTRYCANQISLKIPCLDLQRLDPQIGIVHLLRPGRVSRIRPATMRKLVTASYNLANTTEALNEPAQLNIGQ